MVLVNSEELDKKARQIRNLDFTKENRFNSDNMYWNYRSGIAIRTGNFTTK